MIIGSCWISSLPFWVRGIAFHFEFKRRSLPFQTYQFNNLTSSLWIKGRCSFNHLKQKQTNNSLIELSKWKRTLISRFLVSKCKGTFKGTKWMSFYNNVFSWYKPHREWDRRRKHQHLSQKLHFCRPQELHMDLTQQRLVYKIFIYNGMNMGFHSVKGIRCMFWNSTQIVFLKSTMYYVLLVNLQVFLVPHFLQRNIHQNPLSFLLDTWGRNEGYFGHFYTEEVKCMDGITIFAAQQDDLMHFLKIHYSRLREKKFSSLKKWTYYQKNPLDSQIYIHPQKFLSF